MGWRGDFVSTSILAFVHLAKVEKYMIMRYTDENWTQVLIQSISPGNLNDNMEGRVRGFVWDVMERRDWPRGIFQENL